MSEVEIALRGLALGLGLILAVGFFVLEFIEGMEKRRLSTTDKTDFTD